MTISELHPMSLVGISVALACLVMAAVSWLAASERTAGAQASRPVPPIDAEAPTVTQTATFATG